MPEQSLRRLAWQWARTRRSHESEHLTFAFGLNSNMLREGCPGLMLLGAESTSYAKRRASEAAFDRSAQSQPLRGVSALFLNRFVTWVT